MAVEDCAPGSRRFLSVRGHELAVFHLIDPPGFVVLANSCPHAGGNLSAGEVVDGAVICPWHHWSFRLDDGRCTESERVCVKKYDVRVEDGVVYARLND